MELQGKRQVDVKRSAKRREDKVSEKEYPAEFPGKGKGGRPEKKKGQQIITSSLGKNRDSDPSWKLEKKNLGKRRRNTERGLRGRKVVVVKEK